MSIRMENIKALLREKAVSSALAERIVKGMDDLGLCTSPQMEQQALDLNYPKHMINSCNLLHVTLSNGVEARAYVRGESSMDPKEFLAFLRNQGHKVNLFKQDENYAWVLSSKVVPIY